MPTKQCVRISYYVFETTDHRTRRCRPIKGLLVDNSIMDSSLVDNVRQKRPIRRKEYITRHQILSKETQLPLIVLPELIISVKLSVLVARK